MQAISIKISGPFLKQIDGEVGTGSSGHILTCYCMPKADNCPEAVDEVPVL